MPSKTGGRRGSQTETRWQQKCARQYAGRKEANDENKEAAQEAPITSSKTLTLIRQVGTRCLGRDLT